MECSPGYDHVILLHGLNRGPQIMAKMAKYLSVHGYCTHNIKYPSTSFPIKALAEAVFQQIQPLLQDTTQKIHFIGHSLGAILIRVILKENAVPNLGRVVMIAPPNHGSRVADKLSPLGFYQRKFGVAGQELSSKNSDFFIDLGPATYEVGVIAGKRAAFYDYLFSRFILDKPNDGKVSVENTKLEGMKDQIVLPVAHSFAPNNRAVMQQTAFFLAHGYFQHKDFE
jgi:pimeloyl-ACP methyl ester carboxylesterase